jgi:hypothetical protein
MGWRLTWNDDDLYTERPRPYRQSNTISGVLEDLGAIVGDIFDSHSEEWHERAEEVRKERRRRQQAEDDAYYARIQKLAYERETLRLRKALKRAEQEEKERRLIEQIRRLEEDEIEDAEIVDEDKDLLMIRIAELEKEVKRLKKKHKK